MRLDVKILPGIIIGVLTAMASTLVIFMGDTTILGGGTKRDNALANHFTVSMRSIHCCPVWAHRANAAWYESKLTVAAATDTVLVRDNFE